MENTNSKKDMIKNEKYAIICDKIFENHKWRNNCVCEPYVLNLIGGKLVWTRVEFDCGERIKINCNCLDKIK
jgi:hypothetical protein